MNDLLHPVAKPRPLRYRLTVERIGGSGNKIIHEVPDVLRHKENIKLMLEDVLDSIVADVLGRQK